MMLLVTVHNTFHSVATSNSIPALGMAVFIIDVAIAVVVGRLTFVAAFIVSVIIIFIVRAQC